MRRYTFLSKDSVFTALNKLRSAFLAAKEGTEVDEIIKGLITYDERMKLGRRIQIAQMLAAGETHESIARELKVGRSTINLVNKLTSNYPRCFKLINDREEKVERVFKNQAYQKVGGPKMIHKYTRYTGFRRKDVKR